MEAVCNPYVWAFSRRCHWKRDFREGEKCVVRKRKLGVLTIYLRDLAREGRRKMLRGGRGVCICLCV